jgi:predicted kinase
LKLISEELISALGSAPKIRLVILRGLPGSGKSTFAQKLVDTLGFVHLEADRHFVDATGRYRFDLARASDCHSVCQRDADEALRTGARVVVANTHVRLWELAPYVGLAALHATDWRVVECTGTWPNIHEVPGSVVESMREKWERLPAAFASKVFFLT